MRIRHLYSSVLMYLFAVAIITVGSLYMIGIGLAQETESENQMMEEEVWAQEESSGFIRTWLLCGVFPNPPHKEGDTYDHTPPCVGLDTDYLTEHGGETRIRPVADMMHKRPDGTEAQWIEYTSPEDIIDFAVAFAGQPATNVVAYAYTVIQSEAAGKVVLALGSDDGVRVWLNGEIVHDHLIARGISKDSDLAPVTLKKGKNALLVKVEQGGGGWGFILRLLGKEEALAIEALKELKGRLGAFQNCELRPKGRWDYMFTPGSFPEIVWEKPYTVENLMGNFPIKVRWFNSDLEEVTKADEPGRYVAYVEGQTPSGMSVRRALTLYCRPLDWQPWNNTIKAYADYPPDSPIDQDAWNERRDIIASRVGGQFVQSLETEEYGAVLMSYLHEMKPLGKDTPPTEIPEIINDDIHVALKRKILDAEGKYLALQLPRKLDTPAPVLRKGAAEEAGVKADAAEKIRAVCKEWYEESKEPFVILVAKRGVIIIHEVFDAPDGSLEIDTPLQIASISKAITGTMFAQFLDQGIIDLDDPLGKYLPDFPTDGDKAITLRHCFTHTTGLEGHYEWGGIHNPWLDNVILNGIDYLTPGKIHNYNGMGYDLAGKAMEVVGGKSVARLIHENLFAPLGVSKTTIDDLACCNVSSAEDLARIGQLLLNRGTYGDRVFFSPETFEKLLPKKLSEYYPEIDVEWGTGLTWMRTSDPDAGKSGIPEDKTLLSRNTIGHGAASSAILRVDLDNEVVVAQARNTAGSKYGEYFVKFLKAIDDSIIKE